jgi:hypothetical protein
VSLDHAVGVFLGACALVASCSGCARETDRYSSYPYQIYLKGHVQELPPGQHIYWLGATFSGAHYSNPTRVGGDAKFAEAVVYLRGTWEIHAITYIKPPVPPVSARPLEHGGGRPPTATMVREINGQRFVLLVWFPKSMSNGERTKLLNNAKRSIAPVPNSPPR